MLQVLVNVFLEKFQLQKERHVAMQKLFKEKVLEKMDKCLRYQKQWVLRCPPEEKKEKEDE